MPSYIPNGYSKSENIVTSLNWIFSCFSFLWSRFWKVFVNPFYSLITGKSETVRLLCKFNSSTKLTSIICDQILNGTQFEGTKKLLLKHEPYDVEYASQMFMAEAKVNVVSSYYTEEFRQKVFICLSQLRGANVAMKIVDDLMKEKYDRTNQEHETLLMQLWTNLRNETLKSRDTDQWSVIGFQGRDPASDFRGLGVLSLSNLVYYSREHTIDAVNCLRQNDVVHGGYPMAITGIQISSILNQWLCKRQIDREFYSVDVKETTMSMEERALHFYQELFSRVFTEFDAFYESKHPENLLQFPIIMRQFEQSILERIKGGVF